MIQSEEYDGEIRKISLLEKVQDGLVDKTGAKPKLPTTITDLIKKL